MKKIKYIISESQSEDILDMVKDVKEKFGETFNPKILKITNSDKMPFEVIRKTGIHRETWDLYLREGPVYLIFNQGQIFMIQKQKKEWLIADENDRTYDEYGLMKSLGIELFGIKLEVLLNNYEK